MERNNRTVQTYYKQNVEVVCRREEIGKIVGHSWKSITCMKIDTLEWRHCDVSHLEQMTEDEQ